MIPRRPRAFMSCQLVTGLEKKSPGHRRIFEDIMNFELSIILFINTIVNILGRL